MCIKVTPELTVKVLARVAELAGREAIYELRIEYPEDVYNFIDGSLHGATFALEALIAISKDEEEE